MEQKPHSGEGFTAAEGGCWSLWMGATGVCHKAGSVEILKIDEDLCSVISEQGIRFLSPFPILFLSPFPVEQNEEKNPQKNQKKNPNSVYLFTSHFCLSLFFKDPSFVSLIRCLIREKALLTNRGYKGNTWPHPQDYSSTGIQPPAHPK